jgi:hypothetical protein
MRFLNVPAETIFYCKKLKQKTMDVPKLQKNGGLKIFLKLSQNSQVKNTTFSTIGGRSPTSPRSRHFCKKPFLFGFGRLSP